MKIRVVKHIFDVYWKIEACHHVFWPLEYFSDGDLKRAVYVFALCYPDEDKNTVGLFNRYVDSEKDTLVCDLMARFLDLKMYRKIGLKEKYYAALDAIKKARSIDEALEGVKEVGFVYYTKLARERALTDLMLPHFTEGWACERGAVI